jgi:hypothetical protein
MQREDVDGKTHSGPLCESIVWRAVCACSGVKSSSRTDTEHQHCVCLQQQQPCAPTNSVSLCHCAPPEFTTCRPGCLPAAIIAANTEQARGTKAAATPKYCHYTHTRQAASLLSDSARLIYTGDDCLHKVLRFYYPALLQT